MVDMRLIGDVHGKYEQYKRIIADCRATIQVGDMGIGFRRTQGPRAGEIYGNPPHYAMVKGDHRFIRGNHDNPAECRKHSQWVPDGTLEGDVMFVGGAISIDRAYRIEDYSWWADEELSIAELNALVDVYIQAKPRVMVTHDCPREVSDILLSQFYIGGGPLQKLQSRTCQALQAMWSAHSPELWVFGHYHHSFDHVLTGGREQGTRFVCLNELEYRDDLL
jgi:hypothetical protein